jgi:hypothetical protein
MSDSTMREPTILYLAHASLDVVKRQVGDRLLEAV